MSLFRNKYRVESTRMPGYDYGSEGMYFITIVTKNRVPYFGKIVDGVMHLSKEGEIVKEEWLRTFSLRADMNLVNDEYVIMPDHFHALIGIGLNVYNNRNTYRVGNSLLEKKVDPKSIVGIRHSKFYFDGEKNVFGPQSKNLASIVRGFKSAVSIRIRQYNKRFGWQPRYHDIIVKTELAYHRIKNYIRNNPKNWGKPKRKP